MLQTKHFPSGIVRLAGTKWKAYHSTQFADIVALESADAVCVVKGTKKGLEAVDIDNELQKEKFEVPFNHTFSTFNIIKFSFTSIKQSNLAFSLLSGTHL